MRFLIDANLPRSVPVWQGERFLHVVELNDEWSDSQIWEYSKAHNYTIVTKDADFSNRIIVSEPPPKIVHMRIGNMRLRDLISFIGQHWQAIEKASAEHKLVSVFADRILSIA